eukprot:scaffold64860_cov14-Prasinocladus_malaysianus.AAC.1
MRNKAVRRRRSSNHIRVLFGSWCGENMYEYEYLKTAFVLFHTSTMIERYSYYPYTTERGAARTNIRTRTPKWLAL